MYQELPKGIKSGIKRVGRPKLSERRGQISTQEKILEVAARLFLQKGYAAVAINEITEAVQVTKPTLYHYFGDKESLYISALNRMILLNHKHLVDILNQQHPFEDSMKQVVGHFMATHSGCSLGFTLKDVNAHLDPKQVEALRFLFEDKIIQPLSQFLLNGMAHRIIRQEDPTFSAWMALHVLDGLAFQYGDLGRFNKNNKDETHLTQLFINYFSP